MRRSHVVLIALVAIMASTVCARVSGYKKTTFDEVDRDLYTDSANANTNYGGSFDLLCGDGLDVYIHITLRNRPAYYQSARFCFMVQVNSNETDIYVLLAPNEWNEYNLTHANKPSTLNPTNLGVLGVCAISEGTGWYFVDVMEILKTNTDSQLSFCLHAPGSMSNLSLYAREHNDYPVHIEYIEENFVDLAIFIIVGVVAVIVIFSFVAKRRRRKETTTEVLYRN